MNQRGSKTIILGRHFNEITMIDRETLRQQVKSLRQTISLEQKKLFAVKAAEQIFTLPVFQSAQHVACYLSTAQEISCEPIIQAVFQLQKKCYLPIVDDKQKGQMQFIEFNQETILKPNRYQILQPVYNQQLIIPPEKLDLIIMPLVGFDRQGHRLGSGAGYYDRALANTIHPYRLGLAFSLQELPAIPVESWDINLHMIVTEKKVIQIR